MLPEGLNQKRGGDFMKCIFCGKEFKPVEDGKICNDCICSVEELTNGKGGDGGE